MTPNETAEELPPVLYHYTDAAGLQGILGPGEGPISVNFPDEKARVHYRGDHNLYTNGRAALFRATDIRYMNDSLELIYGARIVNERLEQAAAGSGHPALRSAFAEVAHAFDPDRLFEWPFRCFAVCFCERGDLLSQWRGYSGGVGGFSIGFPRDVLARYSFGIHLNVAARRFHFSNAAALVKVSYGRDQAEARADELVARVERAFSEGTMVVDPDGRPTLFAGMVAFGTIAGIKHEAFGEEREWRLAAVGMAGNQVRTRARASGIVPYMDVVVNARVSGDHGPEYVTDTPLSKVIVGPNPSPDGQVAAVRDLLASRGEFGFGEDVPVVKSEAPFRG